MKKTSKRVLSVILILVLLVALLPQIIPSAMAVDYLSTLPQKHYGDYGTVNLVYDQGSCYSMQGMTVDANYTYCAKIGSNDAISMIVRLEKATGTKVNMVNASNNSYYFYNLGHANALDLATINGVTQMFVTGGANLIRLTMNGTTLTTAGTYTATYNGAAASMTAAQIMYASSKEVKIIVKSGRVLYTGTLDPTASTGNIELSKLCTLDVTNVRLKGEMQDYSTYTQQGFDYHDGKVFLPLTGNAYVETINHSVVLVYDLEGVTGTIRNDPTLSFRVISGTYAGLFEIEDVAVCDYDGKLYFSTNRRKTASETDYDAVSYFMGYVYDPSMSTIGPADYRWETVNNDWVTVMDGGNTFNNPIRVSGAMSNDTMSSSVFHMNHGVVLQHDKPWAVEWKSSGTFGGGAMLLSGGKTSTGVDEPYVFRFKNSTFISMGYYDGKQHNNYGIKLSDHGIDGVAEHVYRLSNKINSDGSNMVYLSVDGKELGALNNYYIGLADQNKQVNWVSGKDLTFNYQGTINNPLDQCKLEYLQVWSEGVNVTHSNNYRWETANNNLTSVTGTGYTANTPIIYNGSVSGNTYTSACFRLSEPVTLLHDQSWSIQWECEGALNGGTFLLSAGEGGRNPNAPFLFRYGSNLIFLGAHDGTQHSNYGIDLTDYGIDGTAKHTYCLKNEIASDGSNMVYLYVDGQEVGPMNNVYAGITDKNTTSNWLNGRDLSFNYIGNRSYAVSGQYSYIQVNEDGCSHSYTSKVTAPTCTTQGSTTYTCSLCGDTFVDNITAATGHNYTTTTNQSTCTTAGSVTSTCKNCGDTFVENLPLKEHSYSIEVISPTCTEKGYTLYRCNCGYSKTDYETSALGHSYKTTVIEPNCINPGYTTYHCSACGDSYVSNQVDALGHSYKATVIEPTCTTGGYTTYRCTTCGTTTQGDETAATGHNYSTVVTEPTCTSGGYTTYRCNTCGFTTTGNETAPIEHKYTSVVTAPTCTNGGYTTYRCTVCGYTTTGNETSATGHKDKAVVTEPTCTNKGYTTYTCTVCGDSYIDNYTAAIGHKYTSQVTSPTCTNSGYTIYTCTVCNYSYKDQVTNPLGHSYQETVIAPNCTTGGYTVYTCACGDRYTDNQTAPAGHSFADGICGVCGAEDPDYAQIVIPTLTLKAPTLEFKDMITVNAMFTAENLDSVVEMGMITYSTKVDSWSVETAEHVIPGTTYDESTGRYIAASQGIHAKYLGDTVYLACYAKLTDGTYAYTKLAGYSPVQYATSKLKGNDVPLKQLVVAMLNYGAAAQTHFNHNVENLANATLTAEQIKLPEAYRSDMVSTVASPAQAKQGAFYNNKGFAKRYPSISFEGAFCINYFFTPNYAPVDGITLYYWNAADYEAVDVLSISNASGSFKMEGSGTGEYRGDIVGIAAKALGEGVYVAAVYSDGTNTWTSGVLGYSIGAYCSSQATKGGTIADLAMATAVYGYQAKQYFG